MRIPLAAVLIAALPACAANGGDGGKLQVGDGGKLQVGDGGKLQVGEPVLVARSGPDTLSIVGALSNDGRRLTGLRLAFESTEPDTILARGTQATVGPWSERAGSDTPVPTSVHGNEVVLEVPSLDPSHVEVALPVVRVREWRQHERDGLMDASLDEIEWTPYLLRFAGEGESCWLAVSLVEPDSRISEGTNSSTNFAFSQVVEENTDPRRVLPPVWAAENLVVTDAKGRVLVCHSASVEGETALASFSTHAPGTSAPEGEPTIQYPVTVRLRVAARFATQFSSFRFRGLTLSPK